MKMLALRLGLWALRLKPDDVVIVDTTKIPVLDFARAGRRCGYKSRIIGIPGGKVAISTMTRQELEDILERL